MSIRTTTAKILIKNRKLFYKILKVLPKDMRKEVLKVVAKIMKNNKISLSFGNIKTVFKFVVDKAKTFIDKGKPVDFQDIESSFNDDLKNNIDFDKEDLEVFDDYFEGELGEILDEDISNILNKYEKEIEDIDTQQIKIIFLSGNAVIFSHKTNNINNINFFEPSFEALKRIVDKTGAEIIVTSGIRKNNGGKKILEMKLEQYGLKDSVIGYTTNKLFINRKEKIERVLDFYEGNINKFIILDKRSDLGDNLNGALIQCKYGIDKLTENKAINMLNF